MGTLLGHVKGIKKYSFSIFMFLLGLAFVYPFIFMLSASVKTHTDVFNNPAKIIPEKFIWTNFAAIFDHDYYFTWYLNSIITVVLLVAFRFLIVTMAAYAFARLNFKGKSVIFMILLSSMLISPDTTIVARFLLYNVYGLTDTIWAIVLPGAAMIFFMFLVRQFFMTIPFELTESALMDGCSHFRIYWRIMLPLSVPVLLTVALFSFIWGWNDFVNPYVFINSMEKQLLTVGLKFFQTDEGNDYPLQMAGASFGIIPVLVLFIVTQKYFIAGISRSGIKG